MSNTRRGFDMDDIPSSSRGEKRKRPSDVIDIFPLSTKTTRLRPLPGGVFLYAGHWVKTVTKEGKQSQFYAQCSAFDPETGKVAGGNGVGHCPWCELNAAYEGAARLSKEGYLNAMNMTALKKLDGSFPRPSPEEKESGYKIKDSETETPIVALRLPMGVLGDVKKLKEQNRSGEEDEDGEVTGEAYPVSDPEHGAIITITKDADASAAKMYSVLISKRNHKMPVEWKKYLRWDLSELVDPIEEEEARSEFANFIKRTGEALGYTEFMQDSGKSKKRKSVDDEDDDLDDDETPKRKSKKVVEDDDDDFDEAPKRKSKKVVEEDDFDEDEDEPTPKRKAKKVVDDFDDEEDEPPKRKSKKVVEEDDFDDEEDEAPKRKSKKSKPDDDDSDDEDEDEPAPKRKSKKVVEEEDDDFDDEPPKRKAKKVVDDFDDEDDDL